MLLEGNLEKKTLLWVNVVCVHFKNGKNKKKDKA